MFNEWLPPGRIFDRSEQALPIKYCGDAKRMCNEILSEYSFTLTLALTLTDKLTAAGESSREADNERIAERKTNYYMPKTDRLWV